MSGHPSWSLPHRAWPTQPTDPDRQVEWAWEALLALYVDTDESDLVDVLHMFRPDLTHAELFEAIEALCVLSVAVFEAAIGAGFSWPVYEQLQDEYRAALTDLAIPRPVVAAGGVS